jgi:hypothetical protein
MGNREGVRTQHVTVMSSSQQACVHELNALWRQSPKYDGKPLGSKRQRPPRLFSECEEHWGERNYFESLLDTAAQTDSLEIAEATPQTPFECYIAEQEKKHLVLLWDRVDPELQNWFANGGH